MVTPAMSPSRTVLWSLSRTGPPAVKTCLTAREKPVKILQFRGHSGGINKGRNVTRQLVELWPFYQHNPTSGRGFNRITIYGILIQGHPRHILIVSFEISLIW